MKLKLDFKILFALVWLVFTVSLASWWLYFALSQNSSLFELTNNPELLKLNRMLFLEGSVLIAMLLIGGAVIVSYVLLENRRSQRLKEFYAAFNHDLKTSLASLRLQAECIEEDLGAESSSVKRLISDTVRLELQINNSLYLARSKQQNLFLQEVELSRLIEVFKFQWPNIEFELENDCKVKVDERAMEEVFKNLIQNSVVHGVARKIHIKPVADLKKRVKIQLRDDGQGFKGNTKMLGSLFHRHSTKSGSGVGLYVCKEQVKKMHGEINFQTKLKSGFGVDISLDGEML